MGDMPCELFLIKERFDFYSPCPFNYPPVINKEGETESEEWIMAGIMDTSLSPPASGVATDSIANEAQELKENGTYSFLCSRTDSTRSSMFYLHTDPSLRLPH